jgi:hypothetical protein
LIPPNLTWVQRIWCDNAICTKHVLSAVLRRISDHGTIHTLDNERAIDLLLEMATVPENPFESIDRILLYIFEHATSPNEFLEFNPPHDYRLYTQNHQTNSFITSTRPRLSGTSIKQYLM